MELEFQKFPIFSGLNRETVVTEKIDGTNACIIVREDDVVYAQSRTRVITPEDDNFGFARWVKEHEDELRIQLGYGRHFGEWWGPGIQRGYGIKEKRFSLFNRSKWHEADQTEWRCAEAPLCHVTPVIATLENFDTEAIKQIIEDLKTNGSVCAPGFMKPEGVVVFHSPSQNLYKVTCEDDHKGKTWGA